MNLLPIPWMKYKLEVLYDINIKGNLFLLYKDLDIFNSYDTTPLLIDNLLNSYNINLNKDVLYLYIPVDMNPFLNQLVRSLKNLHSTNVKVILCGYNDNELNLSRLDYVFDVYTKYPELSDLIDDSKLVDSSKVYEVFTALSDTHRININPTSSCTLSACTLNTNLDSENIYHISFVELLDENNHENFCDLYIKGLTNKNNNFKYNL